MNRQEDFDDLNQLIFAWYNSNPNKNIFGQPKDLSIYDVQYLIQWHTGNNECVSKNAASAKLLKWL